MGNGGTLRQDCFFESAQVAGKGQSSLSGSRDWGEVLLVLKGNFFSWVRGMCVCGEGRLSQRRGRGWTVCISPHPVNLSKRQLHLLAGRAELLDCWQRLMLLSLVPPEGGWTGLLLSLNSQGPRVDWGCHTSDDASQGVLELLHQPFKTKNGEWGFI